MNANRSALQSYGQAAQMVPVGTQIVMLYDGILKCLSDARSAIEENRIADRFNAIKKASDIVNGLNSGLDFENGGDIAPMLDQFYNYAFFRLQRACMESSVEIVDELTSNVTEMRNAWAGVAKKPEAERPQSPRAQDDVTGPASSGGITVSA